MDKKERRVSLLFRRLGIEGGGKNFFAGESRVEGQHRAAARRTNGGLHVRQLFMGETGRPAPLRVLRERRESDCVGYHGETGVTRFVRHPSCE